MRWVAPALCLFAGCGFSVKGSSAGDAGDATIDDAATDAETDALLPIDAPIDAQLCATPPSGQIAWWPGDTVDEVIGNRTSTLVNGAVAGTPGKVGGAFAFDGFNDRVNVVTDLPALTTFTIEGWIDFDVAGNSSWRTVLGNDNGGRGVWMKDRRICWYQASSDRFISDVTISTTGWHHFALVYGTDGVFRGYVDGVAAGTASYAFASLPAGATIGGYNGYELDGMIDELSVYDRALTVEEIGAIVAADVHGKCR
ncbi:MAG: LamG domain-containing protein [Kofleriaceae bacterium]